MFKMYIMYTMFPVNNNTKMHTSNATRLTILYVRVYVYNNNVG